MAKFFRNIRQKLLVKNRFSHYFLYALGEIVIIMIGIIAALMLNSWNDQRKRTELQIETLNDLKSNIQANIKNLEEGIEFLDTVEKSNLKIINYYEQKTPYSPFMEKDFVLFLQWWEPDFTEAAFDNLKSVGVNLISDDNLRKSIIDLFDVDMDILDISDTRGMEIILQSMKLPIQKKYFYRDYHSGDSQWATLPMNYDKLMSDPEFYSVCTEYLYRQQQSIKKYKDFNHKSMQLIRLIDAEIDSLKK